MSFLQRAILPLLVLVTAIAYWLLTYEPASSSRSRSA